MFKLSLLPMIGSFLLASISPLQAKSQTTYLLVKNDAMQYEYNKNGLLSKSKSKSKTLMRLIYKKSSPNRLQKVIRAMDEGNDSDVITFTYKNGYVIKAKAKNATNTITYNKKHLITKVTGGDNKLFKYNKKNQVSRYYSTDDDFFAYTYDEKGYLTNSKSYSDADLNNEIHYTNYYNNKNLLIRTVSKSKYIKATTNYKYKKYKINAKYQKEITKQQNALLSKNGYRLAYLNELPL